jgi:hypothetical protein
MRLPVLFALLALPTSAFAADAPRHSRTLVITKTVMATPVPSYEGPYSCTPVQVRSGCWNLVNSSSHFGFFDGNASCVCSRFGR